MAKFEKGDIVKYITATSGIYIVEVLGPGRDESYFEGTVIESNYTAKENGVGITTDLFMYDEYKLYKERPDPMNDLIKALDKLEKDYGKV